MSTCARMIRNIPWLWGKGDISVARLKVKKQHKFCPYMDGGGVRSGKVGTGMCGPDRGLFRPLRFINGPLFI